MVPRRLLLVGEGNFSFTASLIDTLDPGVSVTATCLQHPADLDGDAVTQENLQRLRERGSGSHPSARPGPERGGVTRLGSASAPPGGAHVEVLRAQALAGLRFCLSGLQTLRRLSIFFARYRCSFWCGLHSAGTLLAGTRQRL